MNRPPSESLLKALAVTAELTGTELSREAAQVMASDLAQYPENQVIGALSRCRKELKGKLTVADVIARLADGRPGAEEAWAQCSHLLGDEGATVVWTEEMSAAFNIASGLPDDPIAARMAFKEAYQRELQTARDAARPVKWSASLGWRAQDREAPLLRAKQAGLLPAPHVYALLGKTSDDHILLEHKTS